MQSSFPQFAGAPGLPMASQQQPVAMYPPQAAQTAPYAYSGGGGGGGAGAPLAPPPPPSPSPLGLLIPGRPISTSFVQTGPTQFGISIPEPGSVQELAVFLVPGQALPPGYGLAIYWSPPPFTDWAALGTTSPTSLSGIFRTGWPSTPALAALPEVRLGVSLETGDTVTNLQAATGAATDKGIAQLLAEDLVTCLGSYAQTIPGLGERIVLPASALPAWLARVADKTRADPNFQFLRKETKS